jgi:quinol monooxygenase YgiN
MDKADPKIIVTGDVKIAAKDGEVFVKVLQAHVLRVRKKDGCVAHAFAADVVNSNVVRMSEAWRDPQSPEKHLADGEFQGVRKELAHIEFIERSVNAMAVRR